MHAVTTVLIIKPNPKSYTMRLSQSASVRVLQNVLYGKVKKRQETRVVARGRRPERHRTATTPGTAGTVMAGGAQVRRTPQYHCYSIVTFVQHAAPFTHPTSTNNKNNHVAASKRLQTRSSSLLQVSDAYHTYLPSSYAEVYGLPFRALVGPPSPPPSHPDEPRRAETKT